MKIMSLITPVQKVIFTLLLFVSLSGCGGEKLAYRDLPVEQLYIEAQKYSLPIITNNPVDTGAHFINIHNITGYNLRKTNLINFYMLIE